MVIESKLEVEVAYAKQDEQLVLQVIGEQGMTLAEAVEKSGILARFPEIDFDSVGVGVYGKKAGKDDVLHPGDRVEIYRPLIADPKESRKKRAAKSKSKRRSGGENDAKTEKKA